MKDIDEKIRYVIEKGYPMPYVEYYSHEREFCFKFDKPDTKYQKETIVLCPIRAGFTHAIDHMVSYIDKAERFIGQ